MARLIVVGAGPMGLAAAHRAASLGHAVDVVEADHVPGGMAAHADLGGLSVERFYQFVCKADVATIAMLDELGLAGALQWRTTTMGYFVDGRVEGWGDPLSLLRFPHLGLVAKLRTGLQMRAAARSTSFAAIEHLTARNWLEQGSGTAAYAVLWKRLLEFKFHDLADEVSASWVAARIRRIATSRRSPLREELGFIEGGSGTLVNALVEAIRKMGGRLHLRTPVTRIDTEGGQVNGVHSGTRFLAADAVISTIPAPLVPKLVPDLPSECAARYAALRNIGAIGVVLELKRSVSPHFWLNIADPEIDAPGLIELSRLRPFENTVVYVPYYMRPSHPKWVWDDARFIEATMAAIQRINPDVTPEDVVATRVSRQRHAQPVCEPGFADRLPPIQTSILGLQIADTGFYYPEDRGISESIRLGRTMAEAIGKAN